MEVNPMEFITTSTATLSTVMTSMISVITAQPVLALCLTAGTIIPLGIGLFRKLKK